jgi:hypothetical protein
MREHLSTVVRFIEALERQDVGAAIQCLDRGVYFASTGEDADFSTHEGFRRWWDLQSSSRFELYPLKIESLDDQHVFAEVVIGHPEDDGQSWSAETMAWVITGDVGVIEAIEMFADAEIALRRARSAVKMFGEDGPLKDG